jgi:putative tryptophan/tyrosine transport system substrate-binding protein
MKRREFLGALCVGAGWPLIAHAQSSTTPAVGFLRSTPRAPFESLFAAFRQGLNDAGFVEGQNVSIASRYANNRDDQLPVLLGELVRKPVAVIVGNNTSALAAVSAKTPVPFVFATGGDPVRDGLVANLNRPGGNMTGVVFFSSILAAKRLELLRQLVPAASTIAVLTNRSLPNTEAEYVELQAAALAVRQQLIVADTRSDRDIDAAFDDFLRRGAGALYVGAGPFFNSRREHVIALAARHRLPASYGLRDMAAEGGLMSYAASQQDAYRQAGAYAGRILKGDKPGDLPVIQSSKFEFVINLKTAKALGLTVPLTLQAAADEVIE